MFFPTLLVALVIGQDLTDANFDKLRDQIVPTRDELKWRSIPWQPTVWDALVVAQKQEKPILLYAMNGNPLGCV